uniref:Paired domain-containing protein n=1 Tax=Acrobeloides nanus TaxID=290746 RepID=A0A914E6N4_9BILA
MLFGIFSMADQKKSILKLSEKGNSERKIAKLLDVPKLTVHRVIARFNETGSFKRKPGSGRPRTARTKANKAKIKGRIQRNPSSRKNSTRKLGKALGIGPTSVRRILKEDLGMKSRRMAKGQLLNDDARNKRLERFLFILLFYT